MKHLLLQSARCIYVTMFNHKEDSADVNETSGSTANAPRQNNRKRKALDPTEELVKLASKRLQEPQDDSDEIAAAWAVELQKMDPQQQFIVCEESDQ
ncbi:unnamed protein product [Acanthoscelides obtectus]|uniref:Uncharacterized protein n=1 Tax=Acanthoscelides obtectus TaxID=200917 RepID=A0A9P0Q870_ACAOB|nr:unnamed protein product [Acanthoscelides obtectus]CAK1624615.1 hypothetical protein AOBTE_LOCUS2649 [Acanthoscelides obtectus]